jgi:AcrR family transcriptional regulator
MDTRATMRGRPRSAAIDEAVLEAVRRQLSEGGYASLSFAAVAEEAGTTRPAIYRRWATKAALAESAMASYPTGEPPVPAPEAASDPFDDLVAELEDFRRGVSLPGRLSLVGTMLQSTTAPDAAARYRARIVAPRRARLRAILERATAQGAIDRDADLDVAVTMLTGSWYARCLAGDREPEDWPRRIAELVWRALGGATAQYRAARYDETVMPAGIDVQPPAGGSAR